MPPLWAWAELWERSLFLPSEVTKHGKSDLTAARGERIRKWLRIYREKMLSRGQYLGQLYDIGFDVPETHVIRKDQTMYYAFFAKQWKGPVELRGLEDHNYHVMDYIAGKDLGTVSGHKRTSTGSVQHTYSPGS